MSTAELMMKFSDPNVIKTLSQQDRLICGLIVTLLGMGITFTALIVLQFLIQLLEKIAVTKVIDPEKNMIIAKKQAAENLEDIRKDEELVAVLTAALAMKMKTTVGNIVIRNIRKSKEQSSLWNRAGISEQMSSRF
jgi:glutaconyl-CoA/methylmalonyl-CoA decarboxylase subunit delta